MLINSNLFTIINWDLDGNGILLNLSRVVILCGVGLFVPFVPNGTKFDESRLSRNLNGRFSLNFPDSNMAMRRIICASLGEFLCSKLEISLKTQENIFGTKFNESRLSQNLNGRFSLNFPDSYMAIRWIICASLGEFLCAKLEISFKIGGLFGTQADISKFEW